MTEQLEAFRLEVEQLDPDSDPSIYSIVDRKVIPETKDFSCSYALMLNPQGIEVTHFITHAWSEGVKAFCDTVSKAGIDGGLWICFLANPQTWEPKELNKLLGTNPFTSPFYQALTRSESVVAVRNVRVNLYTRLWCVFELRVAQDTGKYVQFIGDNPQSIDPALLDLARHTAVCSREDDADLLRGALEGMPENLGPLPEDNFSPFYGDRVQLGAPYSILPHKGSDSDSWRRPPWEAATRIGPERKSPDNIVSHVVPAGIMGRPQAMEYPDLRFGGGGKWPNWGRSTWSPFALLDSDSVQLSISGEPVADMAPLASLCCLCKRDTQRLT